MFSLSENQRNCRRKDLSRECAVSQNKEKIAGGDLPEHKKTPK